MKGVVSVALAALVLFGASPGVSAADAEFAGTVHIRIRNVSELPFSETTIRFPSQQEAYGPLAPGADSEYREIAIAYRYASMHIVADGERYGALAVDYLSEQRLQPGWYTYAIRLQRGAPFIELLVDEEQDERP